MCPKIVCTIQRINKNYVMKKKFFPQFRAEKDLLKSSNSYNLFSFEECCNCRTAKELPNDRTILGAIEGLRIKSKKTCLFI